MMEPLRVCIVGCGAIGSLFAAHLARVDGVEVWVYDLAYEHVAAMNRDGLAVVGEDPPARVHATTSAAEIPPCRLGIVTTKSMHTESAVSAVAHAFADGAVASLQNGVGNEETVARHVSRVIRGSTLLAGHLMAPGLVQLDAPGDTWVGPFEPQPASDADIALLADVATRGGLPTHSMPDARGAQWTKLLFNASTSAIGALTALSVGQIGEDPELLAIVSALIDEGRRVAAAHGIELDADPEAMVDDAVRSAYFHRASMLQDVTARRATEIAVLNGGIVEAGRAVGVDAPFNAAMCALVRGLERSWTVEGESR